MAEPPEPATTPGPREVFARMKQHWLDNTATVGDSLLAYDAVVEIPFAAPGRPRRFQGRAQFLAFAEAARASTPVRITDCREVAIHDTTDPEVIVVEYELTGVVTTTDYQATAPFIGVLRVRDGRIVAWREYQHTMAIAQALGQPPAPST
jgi:uncharacterized protein